jgi:hypothetical protein
LQAKQRRLIDKPLDLDPVFPFMSMKGIEQTMVEGPVIGKDKEAFAVEVEAAYGIDVSRYVEEIIERRLPGR